MFPEALNVQVELLLKASKCQTFNFLKLNLFFSNEPIRRKTLKVSSSSVSTDKIFIRKSKCKKAWSVHRVSIDSLDIIFIRNLWVSHSIVLFFMKRYLENLLNFWWKSFFFKTLKIDSFRLKRGYWVLATFNRFWHITDPFSCSNQGM